MTEDQEEQKPDKLCAHCAKPIRKPEDAYCSWDCQSEHILATRPPNAVWRRHGGPWLTDEEYLAAE